MPRYSLEVASLSHVGKVRSYNEDNLFADAESGIVGVADGMGGRRAGEIASRLATEAASSTLKRRLSQAASEGSAPSSVQLVEEALALANRAIREKARHQPSYDGMGTTLALALFQADRVAIGHIGDSRVYRLRDGRLQLLTRDDTLLQDQIEVGLISARDAGGSQNRHLVTRALGIEESAPAHATEEAISDGDMFLLCTDGLNDLVEHDDIELIVRSLASNLPLAAHHLVQCANDNGGYDNVSVVLVRVRAEQPAAVRKGWIDRLFGWIK